MDGERGTELVCPNGEDPRVFIQNRGCVKRFDVYLLHKRARTEIPDPLLVGSDISVIRPTPPRTNSSWQTRTQGFAFVPGVTREKTQPTMKAL